MLDIIRSKTESFFDLKNKNRNWALDGLRGIAILMVFNVHLLVPYMSQNYFVEKGGLVEAFLDTIQSGHMGVELFFVLSGFLIYRSIKSKKTGFIQYVQHRYKRLLPLVLVVTIPIYVAKSFNIETLINNITFLQIFNTPLLISITWALVYEVYFYLLAGLLLIILNDRITKNWSSFIFIAFIVWAMQFLLTSPNFSQTDRFMGFFAGMAVAKMVESGSYNKIPWKEYLGLIGIIGILLLQIYAGVLGGYDARNHDKIIHNIWFLSANACFALILIAALEKNMISKILSSVPLRIMGLVSYPFFLIHVTWARPMAKNIIGTSLTGFELVIGLYVLAFIISFIISVFLWRYFEYKPKQLDNSQYNHPIL